MLITIFFLLIGFGSWRVRAYGCWKANGSAN